MPAAANRRLPGTTGWHEPTVSVSNIDGRNSAPVSVKVRATEQASMGTGGNRPFQTDALAVLEAPAG